MEIFPLVGSLGRALWEIKTMCDQYKVNKTEIQELENFIQDLEQCTPALKKRFTECGRDHLGNIALNKLAKVINEGIEKLNEWSTDRSFFRILSARDRKVELQNMHMKVMSSIQKNLAIASLSVLLDLRASQATIIEQGTEMKCLLTAGIESVQGRMLPEVRAQVVEARRSPFADEKFWEEVLAAVDSRHDAQYASRDELSNLYEDPITAKLMIDPEDPITGNLMIDPVVASNGETYCRWTIIDNDMERNPVNLDEGLTIVVDNMVIRRGLFAAFPEQHVKFEQRRQQYRLQALSWESNGMLADAEVALQNILRWDKSDKKCAELLVNVQKALEKAKGKYTEPSPFLADFEEIENTSLPILAAPMAPSVKQSRAAGVVTLDNSSTSQRREETLKQTNNIMRKPRPIWSPQILGYDSYEEGDVIPQQTKPSPKKDSGYLTKVKDLILRPEQRRSKERSPQNPDPHADFLLPLVPLVSSSQELRDPSASSRQLDRNGSEEAPEDPYTQEVFVALAPRAKLPGGG